MVATVTTTLFEVATAGNTYLFATLEAARGYWAGTRVGELVLVTVCRQDGKRQPALRAREVLEVKVQ